jgi:glycosyltransferase involved in cell wall biosynthesis
MSEYSRQELEEVGFPATGVVPLMIDFRYLDRGGARSVRQRLADGYTNVLSVSRMVPNKCHEDTIKLFYHYKRQINPRSRLVLVGATVVPSYRLWLERLVRRLGIEQDVTFTGHIPDEELAAYHHGAHAYVSMSEHEGFGASLLASMYVGVPVLAFESTAIPYTAGEAAILMRRKDPAVGAEALALLVDDGPLQRRLVAKGRAHVADFAPERVRDRLVQAVARALDLDQAGLRAT